MKKLIVAVEEEWIVKENLYTNEWSMSRLILFVHDHGGKIFLVNKVFIRFYQ